MMEPQSDDTIPPLAAGPIIVKDREASAPVSPPPTGQLQADLQQQEQVEKRKSSHVYFALTPTIAREHKDSSVMNVKVSDISLLEIRQYHFDFEQLLDDGDYRALLRDFLDKNFNLELLLFYEDVERYRLLLSNANRYKEALRIADTYIRPLSQQEINISQHLRRSVLSMFDAEKQKAIVDERKRISKKNCPVTIFNDCTNLYVRAHAFVTWS